MLDKSQTADLLRSHLGENPKIYTVYVPHASTSCNYYRVFAIVNEDGKPRLCDIALYVARVTGMERRLEGSYQGCIKGRSISPEDIAANMGLYLYEDHKKVSVERM